ncbi:MAG: hypothetical protein ABIE43_00230 [Patescibacteria group bacterium]
MIKEKIIQENREKPPIKGEKYYWQGKEKLFEEENKSLPSDELGGHKLRFWDYSLPMDPEAKKLHDELLSQQILKDEATLSVKIENQKRIGIEKFGSKEISLLIDKFKKEENTENRLIILEKILDLKIVNNDILDLAESFTSRLEEEDKRIWEQDEEYAEWVDGGDDNHAVLEPFIYHFIEIIKFTKGSDKQKRGEEVLLKIIKNWDDYEIYDLARVFSKTKKEIKERLIEDEFYTMHEEHGFDEHLDDFPEDIKAGNLENNYSIDVKNRAIGVLGRIGTKKSIDFLIEEFIKGGRSAHNTELATMFFRIDADYAKEKLPALTRSREDISDKDIKEIVELNASVILYKLNFGELKKIDKYGTGMRLIVNENLEKNPSAADKLYLEYARMIKGAYEAAEEISKIYEDIFFEKFLGGRERAIIRYNITEKATDLIIEGQKRLGNASKEEQEEIVDELINNLKRQEKVQKEVIDNLKEMQVELNKIYKKIGRSEMDEEIKAWLDRSDEEIEEEHNKKTADVIKGERIKYKKYNSNRIIEMIETYKSLYTLSNEHEEAIKNSGATQGEIEKLKRSLEKEDRPKYEPIVKILEKLLELQQNLEKQLDQFVTGEKNEDSLEDIGNDISRSVFQKYQEIIDLTKKNKKELRGLFKGEKDISDEEIDAITESLLKKANTLLTDFTNRIKQGEDINEEEILEELERYRQDEILTASVWKGIDKKDLSPEDLKDVSFEEITVDQFTKGGKAIKAVEQIYLEDGRPVIPASSIRGMVNKYAIEASAEEKETAQQIMQMLDIYGKNYKDKPKLRAKLLQGFMSKLKQGGDNVVLYLYKKKNKQGGEDIIAFNRFDKNNGNRYFGSFNVGPAMGGSAIGTALLKASLEKEAGEAEMIEADCEPEKIISSKYIEKYGFVVKKIMPNYEDTDITAFNIKREKSNEKYYYRDYTPEDLVNEHNNNFPNNQCGVGEKYIVLKFASSNGKQIKKEEQLKEMLEESGRLVNDEGYVMTRYFFSKDGKEVYCAFERGVN